MCLSRLEYNYPEVMDMVSGASTAPDKELKVKLIPRQTKPNYTQGQPNQTNLVRGVTPNQSYPVREATQPNQSS